MSLLEEELMRLSAAAKIVPVPKIDRAGNGANDKPARGVNTATLWRWCTEGVRGVKLESIVVGGIRYTSRPALERFFSATTAAADQGHAATSPGARRRKIEASERACEELGV
jgi:hypothetical protein